MVGKRVSFVDWHGAERFGIVVGHDPDRLDQKRVRVVGFGVINVHATEITGIEE